MLGMPVAGINVIILAVVVAVALHAVSASPTNRMSLQQRVRRALGDVVAEKNRLVEAKSRQVILEDLQGASLQEATRLLSNTDPGFGRSDTYERQRYDPSGINPNIEVVIEFLHERKNVTVAPTTPSPASAAVGNDGSDDLWLKVDIGHHSGITRSSAWSKWSPCTVTCGQGFQVRIRSCGEDCTETAKRECRKKPCPRAALLEYEDEPDDYDDDPLESLRKSCGEDCTETAKRECRKKPCPRAALLEYEDEPDDYDDDPLESLRKCGGQFTAALILYNQA
ncbi:unnamed protein product [Notodromas monacha]|uniref:Uncharacterized protein n=1 Tax=Notodromas monacha TaxID=399045 RepID=A0A7R9BI45_9CRUS|nr:unnamed protein product [Notodromas monacha]CAG0915072.1 unnamed protein product [Notodromas monacha]